jgi:hypothetical protein
MSGCKLERRPLDMDELKLSDENFTLRQLRARDEKPSKISLAADPRLWRLLCCRVTAICSQLQLPSHFRERNIFLD